MNNIQVFKITGICNFEGDEEDSPCTCFPDLSVKCLQENCEYFILYDGEIEEDFFDENE